MNQLVTHKGEECGEFFQAFLGKDRKALFIGTLGFSDLCLYFPRELAAFPNVDFLFLVEERPEVSQVLKDTAARNKAELLATLGGRRVQFGTVTIVAEDTANVAGRRATAVCRPALDGSYSDVIVDATTMSRGVCFPIVKQAYERSKGARGANAHVVVAGRDRVTVKAHSMSSDAPQYVHGFQGDMGTDAVHGAIKLWIPQLSEGAVASLSRIHRVLKPEESCLILPFPAADPRRSDLLLREFQEPVLDEWDVNLLDVIYAHESDPTDVCESIVRIQAGRREAFESATDRPDRTVLSPSGTRIGSVGMLLAALRLDLPMMYEENVGYTSDMESVPPLPETDPDHSWHIWLRP